jgi:hypothetical protein
MTPLCVLITNNTLADRAGSELYVRDLAIALLRRGHRPVAFSTHLGVVAEELREATVPVIDHPRKLGSPPDVIHGHHHADTALAVCAFPDVPAVYVCHGWAPWEEAPPRFSRIRRYLAVDLVCRDRLVCEHGFAEADVEVLPNFVDLDRFIARSPLPASPSRALLFANTARPNGYATVVAAACAQAGVALDVVGLLSGKPTPHPESVLGQYDIVFAKARAALEAMAVGCAVILCDKAGAGEMVTAGRFDALRLLNFGVRTLQHPHTVEHLTAQVRRYDAADATAVSARARAVAGIGPVVDRLLAIYGEVIDEVRGTVANRYGELAEIGDYLRWLAPRSVDLARLHARMAELTDLLHDEQVARSQVESQLAALRDSVAAPAARHAAA